MNINAHYVMVSNRWKDMRAVMTPVATPRAKDPLKTPRKMPKDFNKAMASKLWLLSPAGWYATMELKGRETQMWTFTWKDEMGTKTSGRETDAKTQTEIFFFKWTRASSQICNNPIPTADITGQVFIWFCLDFEDFGCLLKNSHKDIRHMDWSWVIQS